MIRRLVAGATLALGVVLVPGLAASAHPLGNFTINHFSGLAINASSLTIDVVTDMAEIPTYQIRGDIDTNHDGTVDSSEADRWRASTCAEQAGRISLRVDGREVPVATTPVGALTFPPGQAGLDTLRLECHLRADLGADTAAQHTIAFTDHNFEGRIGWREVVASAASGATLVASDVPSTSVSQRLTSYPADLLRSPLKQQQATLRVALDPNAGHPPVGAPAARSDGPTSILPRGIDRATRAFTSLVAHRHLTVAFGLLAVAVAALLGSFHALAPGHGKTVMAAYLVGQRGSLRQAALIGLTVTATHTAGVLALGIVLTTSTVIAPEKLYPWLGLASGLLVASIGISLLVRARRTRTLLANAIAEVSVHQHHAHKEHEHEHEHHEHDHEHEHEHDGHEHHDHEHEHHAHREHGHGHADHDHEHGRAEADHHATPGRATAHAHGGRVHSHVPPDPNRPIGWKALVAMGFAGGLVPSPSALVVLLGAIALGRAWFGLVLVVAYGLGMAGMLTGAGLLLVRARGLLERRARHRPGRLVTIAHVLPTATAVLIVIVGLVLASRGAAKI